MSDLSFSICFFILRNSAFSSSDAAFHFSAIFFERTDTPAAEGRQSRGVERRVELSRLELGRRTGARVEGEAGCVRVHLALVPLHAFDIEWTCD